MKAVLSLIAKHLSWRQVVWSLMPVRVAGRVPEGGPTLLTADHRSLCDGPLLAIWLTRPALFAVHADYGRHWFWSHVIQLWCRFWGHRFVVLSEGAPFGLRALLAACPDRLVCLFPEGKISHGSTSYPWKEGVFFLLKHRPDFKHHHMTIASRFKVWGIPVWLSGFDWTIEALPVLRIVQVPVRTCAPMGSGSGFVPNASGGKASTEMISNTRP